MKRLWEKILELRIKTRQLTVPSIWDCSLSPSYTPRLPWPLSWSWWLLLTGRPQARWTCDAANSIKMTLVNKLLCTSIALLHFQKMFVQKPRITKLFCWLSIWHFCHKVLTIWHFLFTRHTEWTHRPPLLSFSYTLFFFSLFCWFFGQLPFLQHQNSLWLIANMALFLESSFISEVLLSAEK